MIKLITADMDGTLLDDDKNLDESFWEVYYKLREKGIYFAPASGRQYYNIYEYFKRIDKGLIIIAENGSFIVEDGKEIYSKSMEKKDVLKLVEAVRNIPDCFVLLSGKKGAYVENDNEEFMREVKKYCEKYEIVEDVTKVDDDILKATICDLKGAEEFSYPYVKKFEKEFKVAVSGFIWIDISYPDSNKGTGLKVLQEKLGISKEETMAFGDYLNDYEMLQQAGYSFAMENAHPELKKIAKYNGGDNNKCGVINSIKKYVL